MLVVYRFFPGTVELSLSNYAASSADVQHRFRVAAAAAFHGLARFFRADDVNLLFTIFDARGAQFSPAVDRFLMVFYCSTTPRPPTVDQVRYSLEVLPATSDFVRAFFLLQTDPIFQNVTVLCFDFCDYETFVLLFPLLRLVRAFVCVCVWSNQSKLWWRRQLRVIRAPWVLASDALSLGSAGALRQLEP